MKRKLKLFSSLSAFALCLMMLVFGVYSATKVTYSAQGTVSYEVKDVFVDVNTKLYRSTETSLTDSSKLATVANALKGATAATLNSVLSTNHVEDTGYGMSGQDDTTLLSTYDVDNNIVLLPGEETNKELAAMSIKYGTYVENGDVANAYYVVITVHNTGSKLAGVEVTCDLVAANFNSNYYQMKSANVPAGETKNFVLGLSLLDPREELVATNFNLSLVISNDEVEEPFDLPLKPLAECSPMEIKQVADAGHVNNNNQWVVDDTVWFEVGDEVIMTLMDNTEVVLQVADFYHDVDENDNTLPITFVMRDLLPTRHSMNSSGYQGSTVGGWAACDMNSYLNTDVYNLIPEEWRTIIKPAKKYSVVENSTDWQNSNKTVETSIDKLFLLSFIEVGLINSNEIYAQEGSQYPVFVDNNSRTKTTIGKTYDQMNWDEKQWWLRSTNSVTHFGAIWDGGTSGGGAAYNTYSICFAFCI